MFFTVGFVMAERNLYLSAMGSSLLVAIGYHKLLSAKPFLKMKFKNETENQYFKNKVTIRCFMMLLVLTFISKSIHRSTQWKNENDLYKSGLNVCPKNAKIYYNIAKLI
jgi:hypothetical protein